MDIKEINDLEFNKFIKNETTCFIFSTNIYLKSLFILGYNYKYFGLYENNKLISIIAVQFKKIKFLKKYYYNIPNGIIGKYNNIFLKKAIEMLKKDALVIKYSSNELIENNYSSIDKTMEIDLSNDLDLIFNNFSKSNRNTVRKGIKENVNVEFSHDLTYVDLFLNNYRDMTGRKNMNQINNKFLREVIINMINNDLGFFALASYNNNIYNIAFISIVGKRARYLYGSSVPTKEKTPPLGQVLHFKIIEYLKMKNYLIYDLGGIPEITPSNNDSIYGVYKFKKGFGGKEVITSYNYKYIKYKVLNYFIK